MTFNAIERRRNRRFNTFMLTGLIVILMMLFCSCSKVSPLAPIIDTPIGGPQPVLVDLQGLWQTTYHPTGCQDPASGSLSSICSSLAAHPDPYPLQIEYTTATNGGRVALGGLWLPLERVSMEVDHATLTASGPLNSAGFHVSVSIETWQVGDTLRGSVGIAYLSPAGDQATIQAQMSGKRVN